jgi:hypothetical protein
MDLGFFPQSFSQMVVAKHPQIQNKHIKSPTSPVKFSQIPLKNH